ncbi:NADPH-dependent stearoyl-CoA 9-desaturase [Nocardioides aquaticus]|uniref:NADPH-dependent stearoyl-CoA 9-desaturase n=1 Tax=Nocardioides aquaticus TaxID=160826 RepID=A0ABX8EID9_9ACTN|nr:acyl-CoA desaturase [Nocardioides aquaticus]QVT80256.1 NADPH-dependent stearoyl-CoA 9-desaturase [Nocardioides aquaticus]
MTPPEPHAVVSERSGPGTTARTSPRTTARTTARTSAAPFTALAAEVRDSGLLRRRYGYYAAQVAACVAALVGVAVLVLVLGDTWWQLVPAAVLGLVVTQLGFLGHDAAHRQVFVGARANDWAARLLSGAGAGLSYGWWRGKHNQHHAAPNQEGRDPDIAPGVLAFTAEIAGARDTGPAGWFVRHQGWLFFPLLTLEGANLHWASVRTLLGRAPVRHRWAELALVTTRLGGYVVALFLVLPPGKAAAFLAVQMAVFGVCLGGSFAPNHKGMPIVPRGARLDFLRRQVLMSRNVRGGPVVDVAMGGLNYQIEHHLFPSMPRPNLRRVQPLVRAHCARHGIAYTEVGLLESYAIVVGYLNHVGLRARDPFQCPLSAALRESGPPGAG